MLWPGDAALAAREQALPGLALLLDDESFLAALDRAAPELGVAGGRGLYVRYKPGTNLLAGYNVETARGPLPVYAITYPASAGHKLEKARLSGVPDALVWEGSYTVVRLFPTDRRLGGLVHIRDGRLSAELAQALDIGAEELPVKVLRYKPERRLVARTGSEGDRESGGEGGGHIVRFYSAAEYCRAVQAHRALRRVRLPLARLVGRAKRAHALAVAWLPGLALDAHAPDHPGWAAAGALLRRLHALDRPRLAGHSAAPACNGDSDGDRSGDVEATAAPVAALAPECAPRAAALAAALHSIAHAPNAARTVTHGDFSPDQCLVGPTGELALLDLDNAAYGDPMSDVAGFTAHLDALAAVGMWTAAAAEGAVARFLAGYHSEEAARPQTLYDPARLAALRGLRLLRLAGEPFRRRRPNWPTELAALLAAAERNLHAVR